jgi:transcriptional regulator with XRE-family HTH domain
MTRRRPLDPTTVADRLGAEPPKRQPTKPDTRLRQELRALFDKLLKIKISLREISRETGILSGSLSSFLLGETNYSVKMLAKLSRSQHLQQITGLDEITLFSVMTLWSLAEYYPPEVLDTHMRQALNVVKDT